MGQTRTKFMSLEACRGIAAILVMLFHIDKYYFSNPSYWTDSLIGGLFKFGHSGVEFFFVLSGFIIFWVHGSDIGNKKSLNMFIKKRIIRIYPLSIITVIISAFLYHLSPSSGKEEYRNISNIIESIFLFGRNPLDSLNVPTWTLWHENIFYIIFSIIILFPKVGRIIFLAWFFLCIFISLYLSDFTHILYVINPINSLFMFGALASFFLKRSKIPLPSTVASLGIISFFSFGMYNNQHDVPLMVEHLVYGGAAALSIMGLVEMERSGNLAPGKWAEYLGILSYPLYLTHFIVLAIAAKLAAMTGMTSTLPPMAGAAAISIAAIIVGFGTYYGYERPVSRWLRRRFLPATR